MKKLIMLSSLLLIPFAAFAISTDFNTDIMSAEAEISKIDNGGLLTCIQVVQSAISANGECKEFSTPCEVPDDWKKVSSCENYENKVHPTARRIGDVIKRRYETKWAKLRERSNNQVKQIKNKDKTKYQALRDSHRFVKNNVYKRLSDSKQAFLRKTNRFIKNKNKQIRVKNKFDKKTTTAKKWKSSFRKLVNPARQKMIDKKQKLMDTKAEAVIKNRLHKKLGSPTTVKRTGALSNKFWSTAKKLREKRLSPTSETARKAIRSRQPFRKAKPKKLQNAVHAKLRRSYRGAKMSGSLE